MSTSPAIDSAAPAPAALAELLRQLRAQIRGEVLSDPVSLGLYATDASIYQIMPLAVVLPLDRADALRAVRLAGQAGVAILPRGGGTSLSGQTIDRAVVIDVSKHMTRLLEVNAAERWARVEPGLVCDELNARLKPLGLQFAPDPATSDRANLGGMIANNSAGMRSIRYGMTIDHLLGLDLALATGEVLNLGELSEKDYAAKCALPDREGGIYRGFKKLMETNHDEILLRFPKVPRRSGGYSLDAFARPFPWNMARLVAASEGTLGLILEARVGLVPLPGATGLAVAQFASQEECLRAVAPSVEHGPSAVEFVDEVVLRTARASRLTRDLCGFLAGEPKALLLIEAQEETVAAVEAKLAAIIADLRRRGFGYAHTLMLDEAAQQAVWLVRKSSLGLIRTVKGDAKPIDFIDDAAVPLEYLPDYIARVQAVCARHGRPVSFYAHASVGLLHASPMIDLHAPADRETMKQIAEEVFNLVVEYKGSWSGEHGDGIVRGGFNERFFGAQLYAAFRELKRLFDPGWLMNPGKIVDTPPMDAHLRYGNGYSLRPLAALFHYRETGGFREAVERCTGVGACRKTLGGTMCPSYVATRDEEHSTRGRANALRLAMTGQFGAEALESERIQDVLSLCLSCKGCKSECPNNVDMARLKAEVTHRHHLRHGATLRERLFRDVEQSAALGSGLLAPLANRVMGSAPLKLALDKFVGIDCRRHLPTYARERLSTWFRRRPANPNDNEKKPLVALFNDTYIEHNEPHVGRAAVEVLEAAGYEVLLLSAGCCQRPAISKGFLDVAKRRGTRTFERLDVVARKGIPILVCEPSCASALTDDLPDLIGDEALARRVAERVKPIEQFLAEELAAGRCTLPLRAPRHGETPPTEILVHGHCHQKALYGTAPGLELLRRVTGATVREVDSGCCGMAGSFGYEKEHYAVSLKVGEERLFPALRAARPEARVAANGFSCRHQIADGTGRQARHIIELLRDALE